MDPSEESDLNGASHHLFPSPGCRRGSLETGRTRMSKLFDPLELGAFGIANRIGIAPLTRARSDNDAVPNPLMAAYYAQRASAGLIISEATGISREGLGWPNAPGLWNDRQIEGWK